MSDTPQVIEIPACPTCKRTEFKSITGTDKYRCAFCGWLVRLVNGLAVDAIDWTRAGKRGHK